MRRTRLLALILSLVIALGLVPYLQAQSQDKQPDQAAAVKAGTKLNAQLESTVDTRTAKPGDEVVARVTRNVKQDGKTVVHKGDRLKGRITEVQPPAASGKAAAESGSRLAVVFDQLVQGESTTQLNTVLTGVLSTPAERRARQEQPTRDEPVMAAPTPAPASGSSSGNAGLLGGATSTVGSTVGAAGSVAGNVAGTADSTLGGVGSTLGATTSSAVGATAGAVLATPAKAIHLDSQAQAKNQTAAGSVLSTRQGHLRLESGTQLQFRVAGSADSPAPNKSE